jgi:hypothetical protein
MVDGTLLDALEAVARHVRRSDKPFGGIQLILSGARPACSSACPAWGWQRPARLAMQCMVRLLRFPAVLTGLDAGSTISH